MFDGRLSLHLSTLPYYSGWHPPHTDQFSKHFCFFFSFLSGCGCLTHDAAALITVTQQSVYFGGICGESLLMVRFSFSPLYFINLSAKATTCCFAVFKAVVAEISLNFLNHSCVFVAFPLAISLSFLTFDNKWLDIPLLPGIVRCLGSKPYFPNTFL